MALGHYLWGQLQIKKSPYFIRMKHSVTVAPYVFLIVFGQQLRCMGQALDTRTTLVSRINTFYSFSEVN